MCYNIRHSAATPDQGLFPLCRYTSSPLSQTNADTCYSSSHARTMHTMLRFSCIPNTRLTCVQSNVWRAKTAPTQSLSSDVRRQTYVCTYAARLPRDSQPFWVGWLSRDGAGVGWDGLLWSVYRTPTITTRVVEPSGAPLYTYVDDSGRDQNLQRSEFPRVWHNGTR